MRTPPIDLELLHRNLFILPLVVARMSSGRRDVRLQPINPVRKDVEEDNERGRGGRRC